MEKSKTSYYLACDFEGNSIKEILSVKDSYSKLIESLKKVDYYGLDTTVTGPYFLKYPKFGNDTYFKIEKDGKIVGKVIILTRQGE